MTLKKLLLTIAGGVGILGALLPWYKLSLSFLGSTTSNAFQMGALYIILAILAILCGVAIILLSVMKEKQIKNIIKIKNLDKLPLFIGIAIAAIAVIAFIVIKAESQGFGNVSWGVWMIGISGVATIVLSCLNKVEQLDKVVFGEAEKPAKKEDKKETTKKK